MYTVSIIIMGIPRRNYYHLQNAVMHVMYYYYYYTTIYAYTPVEFKYYYASLEDRAVASYTTYTI